MAIGKFYLNGGAEVIANWMRTYLVPDYFSEVTTTGWNIQCKNGNDTVLLFDPDAYSADRIKAYRNETDFANIGAASLPFGCDYAYTCENGAMIHVSSNIWILITKTNNGRTAIIGTTGGNSQGIPCVAWGDAAPYSTLTYTPRSGEQTQLVPFCTDAPYQTTSFTPNAYYMPVGQYYTLGAGRLIIGNTAYLTNGYWAIKDEAVST